MFIISESTAHWRHEISRHETFEDAVAALNKFPLVMMEEDADHPGCADAFTKTGLVLSIQPEGFSN